MEMLLDMQPTSPFPRGLDLAILAPLRKDGCPQRRSLTVVSGSPWQVSHGLASLLPCLSTLPGLFTLVHLLYQAFGLFGGKEEEKSKGENPLSNFLIPEKKFFFKLQIQGRGPEGWEKVLSCLTEPCLLLLGFTSLNADKEG